MAIASSTASFAQTTPAAILPSEPAPDLTPQVAAAPTPDLRQVECIAKIIMHEAANEPRIGRVAVAQVIRTRIKSGRFAADACAVAKQHGQFFDVDAFEPQRSTDGWSDAVAIATDTLNGGGDEVAPGALFFHAAYSPMAGRVRVAQIGGHVFYR
ncbi:cell wall hydrolase [Sphingomonas bacterium]|uniref:cell wall hydrolase n=1 Tax=Sphingomonas bacterium TaxID=1895847 RepID=UPI001576654B|nr:cell wall hydrolase [Sphingomonas bacterium]